ncbi:YndM family protein [Bacillus sp. ISL-18]|uniref:YndM family protein n=1 Tax=Bacillus sp. ISL-18 TaxID=2819118 RepID=UPI001BEA2BAF|nr:YndM family protein [Bacillus sp. ISL-18]MBT2659211.1 YndM family protein [Bacillus sp. ISL-18]
MDHIKAIIIKLVMITVVLGIILTGIFDGEFSDSLWISVVLTVLAYVLGDLFIFRKAGDDSDLTKRNIIATLADAVLTFAVVYLMGKDIFVGDNDIFNAALLSAIVVGIGEWFFHRYLNNNVFDEKLDHHRSIS